MLVGKNPNAVIQWLKIENLTKLNEIPLKKIMLS